MADITAYLSGDFFGTYVDCDTHYQFKYKNGKYSCCVSCGKPMEIVKRGDGKPGFENHHCSEQHENRRAAASRRHVEPVVRRMSEASRLSDGFWMLRLDQGSRA